MKVRGGTGSFRCRLKLGVLCEIERETVFELGPEEMDESSYTPLPVLLWGVRLVERMPKYL